MREASQKVRQQILAAKQCGGRTPQNEGSPPPKRAFRRWQSEGGAARLSWQRQTGYHLTAGGQRVQSNVQAVVKCHNNCLEERLPPNY